MADIMSLKNVRNKTSRSGFDLSTRVCFTTKAGQLHAPWWSWALPADHFEIDLQSFMRTAPVATPAQARMRYYYDFFFVPASQIWNKFGSVITQMHDNVQHASGPLLSDNTAFTGDLLQTTTSSFSTYLTAMNSGSGASFDTDFFGFKRHLATQRLAEYFIGSGSSFDEAVSRPNFSLFPWAAYQKIYADFFRFTQWEKPNPSTWDFDYIKGDGDEIWTIPTDANFYQNYNIFDMRYCNYQKDMFHGIMPNAQYGEEAAVPLNFESAQNNFVLDGITFGAQGNASGGSNAYAPLIFNRAVGASSSVLNSDVSVGRTSTNTSFSTVNRLQGTVASGSLAGELPILLLRQYECFQKWKEVSQAASEDYKEQIQAHWGISVSNYLSGQCQYLGGINGQVNVNEVTNVNLVGSDGQSQPADLAGKGLDGVNGKIIFDCKGEYGILMCIQHCLPLVDYITTGFRPQALLLNAQDFPIPEYDSIGMEQLPLNLLSRTMNGSAQGFLGYVPRYIIWKTDYDRALGAFRDSLRNWIIPYEESDFEEILNKAGGADNPNAADSGAYVRYPFFKVNPHILDDLFVSAMDDTYETDPFYFWAYFNVRVTRALDYNGLPY